MDSAVGSKEFAPLLNALGVETAVEPLKYSIGNEAADFAFVTNPDFMERGVKSYVAIERKTLPDMVSSLIKKRLHKQIQGMLTDYDLGWVLLEGWYRVAGDDAIEIPLVKGDWLGKWVTMRGPLTYSQLRGWLTRYDVLGGGRIRRDRTNTREESAAWIAATWRWCMKPWEKHQAMTVSDAMVADKALMFRPTDLMLNAKSLRGVGDVAARRVGGYFESIEDMVQSPVEDWVEALRHRSLKPRELRKLAESVYANIRRKYRTRQR